MWRAVVAVAGAAVLAGCVPYDVPVAGYPRGPYAAPGYGPGAIPPTVYEAPRYPRYAPPEAPVMTEPLEVAPPSAALPPLEAPPPEPAPPDVAPPPDQAGGPGSGDAVTDLLLTPLPQRDAAQPAPAAAAPSKIAPPPQNPLMGFRPMRGQTAPTP